MIESIVVIGILIGLAATSAIALSLLAIAKNSISPPRPKGSTPQRRSALSGRRPSS